MERLTARELRSVVPVIQHATAELLYGASPIHAIAQAATAAYLVGRGMDPRQAVVTAERAEALGLVPGYEPAVLDRLERLAMERGALFGVTGPWGAVPVVFSPIFAP